jgi:hypothetical protein
MEALWWLPRTDVLISLCCTFVALILWLRSGHHISSNIPQHSANQAIPSANANSTPESESSSPKKSCACQRHRAAPTCRIVALSSGKSNAVNTSLIWDGVLGHISSASASGDHLVLLTQCGHVYEWNRRVDSDGVDTAGGEHHTQKRSRVSPPVLVASLARLRAFGGHVVVGIASGPRHALALTSSGHVFSWGIVSASLCVCLFG